MALAYWPALAGGFLFDDYANLPKLGYYGPVSDIPSLLRYATSGIADFTGRPVSTFSFLIDAGNWPADPFPFKRTNLLIHIGNGILLTLVLSALGRRMGLVYIHTRRAALIGAALWCLHPLWVSTVAYVIQRHAMLAATFTLAGILVWIRAMDAFATGNTRKGWALALLSIGGCGLLAGLSKPNGFLLPLLLITLHYTVLTRRAPDPAASQQRAAVNWLLLAPATVIVLGLLWKAVAGWDDDFGRSWTLGERLMTQPRAITSYLESLLVPSASYRGLFADDFEPSHGLLQPWTTLAAMALVAGIAATAVLGRKRWPAFSAALLFFFAGHALESTSIPLELYFEHRNYLPAMLLGWPLAIMATASRYNRWWKSAAVACLVLLLAGLTYSRAALWGHPYRLAMTWADQLPRSPRAQAHAAAYELATGHPERAAARLRPRLDGRHVQYSLNLIDAECAMGSVRADTIAAAESAIAYQGIELDMAHQWLRNKLTSAKSHCEGLSPHAYESLLRAAERHPGNGPTELNRLTQLHGLLALYQGDCAGAQASFAAGLRHHRDAAQVHGQTGLLATHCDPRLALGYLRKYRERPVSADTPAKAGMPRIHQGLLDRQDYWETELDRLEELLVAETTTSSPFEADGGSRPPAIRTAGERMATSQ